MLLRLKTNKQIKSALAILLTYFSASPLETIKYTCCLWWFLVRYSSSTQDWLPGGKDGGGIVREFEINMYILLFKMDNQQDTTCGTLLNDTWQPGCGGSLGENGYMSFCCQPGIITTLVNLLWKWKVKVLVAQSNLTLCDPMDCSPPGSSIHGILQVRILEWAAIPISKFSSQPRGWTRVSCTG